MTDKFVISGIEAVPHLIENELTRTYIEIDPGNRTVAITQWHRAYGTPMAEWKMLVVSHEIQYEDDYYQLYPRAGALAAYLTSDVAQELLNEFADGYTAEWDGSNHRGSYNEAAAAALAELVGDIQQLPSDAYQFWYADDWFTNVTITAETTDAELEILASDSVWLDGAKIILSEDPHDYLYAQRDEAIAEIDDEAEDAPLSIAEQVYQAARPLLPSESWPHIGALSEAGLLDALTISQAATIVHLMQAAYRNGQGSRGAEKIDNDYVWLDGVGGLERQSDGTWTVTAPDQALASSVAADLGRRGGQATSEAKRAASKVNGRKGGRPRGDLSPR